MIHTTRETQRNARGAAGGVLANPTTQRLLMAGSALAGGAATVVVAEKAGLSPIWAGVATSGVGLGASMLVKNQLAKEALYAASLGAGGLVGVQLFAKWWAERKPAEAPKKPAEPPRKDDKKRQSDGEPFVTRAELNDALTRFADKTTETSKQAQCDLLTALREEMKRVVVEAQQPKDRPRTVAPPTASPYFPTRGAGADDEYMRNAYGDDERNAVVDEEYMRNCDQGRNAGGDDDYLRNAYGDEERNAWAPDGDERNAGDDERNATVDDERNAMVDDERNASGDDERNAGDDERNAGDEAA